MPVALDLPPELEVRLRAEAARRELTLETYLQSLIADGAPSLAIDEAVSLYAGKHVSQGQAAALAGVSRAQFLAALGKAEVTPFQYESAEELCEEATGN